MCNKTGFFLSGEKGQCGRVAGDSGDLDPNLGAEPDPLPVLEKVTALGCFPLPRPPSCLFRLQTVENPAALGGKILPLRKCISPL